MLSVSDREKLLNWDAAEESTNGLVSTRKEQVDFIKAAPSVILEKTQLTQDVVPLFISSSCLLLYPSKDSDRDKDS